MAINIRFLADIANWVSGLGTSKDALADNERGLEELMRKAVTLGTQIGKTSDEIAADFSAAFGVPLDRAKSAVEETMSTAAQSTEQVNSAADTTGDKMTGLGSIARDVLAGDFSGAAETAAGALENIGGIAGYGGPVVMALGALAGILGDTLGAAAEEAQKRTNAMFDDMVESGDRALSKAYQLAAAQDLINDPAQLAKAERIAEALGITVPDAILTLIGNNDALAESQRILEEKMNTDTGGKLAGKYVEASTAINDTAGALDNAGTKTGIIDEISSRLDGVGGSAEDATGKTQSLYDKLSNPPNVPPIKIAVDSSAYERFRSRVQETLQINVGVNTGAGSLNWEP